MEKPSKAQQNSRLTAFIAGYLWGQREAQHELSEDELLQLVNACEDMASVALAATQGTYEVLEGWLTTVGLPLSLYPKLGFSRAAAVEYAKRALLADAQKSCSEVHYTIKVCDTLTAMQQVKETLQRVTKALEAYEQHNTPVAEAPTGI